VKQRWILALVVVLAGLGLLWTSIDRGSTRSESIPPADTASPVASEMSSPPALVPPEDPGPTERERAAVQPPETPEPSVRRTCEIRGRFLLAGGVPAAGASYGVHGWQSNEEDVQKHGLPERWEDPSGETDPDGRLSVVFEPPRAYQFTLDVKAPGHAEASWRWPDLLAGQVVDLGDVELVPGGTIEGRIVGPGGDPVPGDWTVYADSVGLRGADGRDETRVIVPVDPLSARFRAEDVMPGRVALHAYDRRFTERTVVQVRPGSVVEADIRVGSREEEARIVLEARSRLLRTLIPEAEHVTLTGPDGVSRNPRPTRMGFGRFVFGELEDGAYELVIDDPRFQTWRCSVRPGAQVEAELDGTSGLALRVVGPSGELHEDFAGEVELRNVDFSPREFDFSGALLALTGGVLTGLTPGDSRVTVRAGELLGAAEVDGLGLAETRALEVRVGPASTLGGRVRYSDGTPAAEVQVALLPATPPASGLDASRQTPGMRARFEQDILKQETGRDGEFRFAIARPDRYLVHASAANGAVVTSAEFELAGGRDDLELVLPRGGTVAGRILAPAGASCAGLRVWIGPREASPGTIAETACVLGAEGRYSVGPIPPGELVARLLLPEQMRRIGIGHTMGPGGLGDHVELGALTLRDGEHKERDFEPAEFPGTVTLVVSVNGEAIAGLGVTLTKEAGEDRLVSVEGETDVRGRFGPVHAFPGDWSVSVRDPEEGWRANDLSRVRVEAARPSEAALAVPVAEASLLFLDADTGEPLVRQRIAVLAPPADWTADFPMGVEQTGADGRATWKLAAGEYRFRLETGVEQDFFLELEQPREDQRIAPIVWTAEGPLVREIRL